MSDRLDPALPHATPALDLPGAVIPRPTAAAGIYYRPAPFTLTPVPLMSLGNESQTSCRIYNYFIKIV